MGGYSLSLVYQYTTCSLTIKNLSVSRITLPADHPEANTRHEKRTNLGKVIFSFLYTAPGKNYQPLPIYHHPFYPYVVVVVVVEFPHARGVSI